MSESINTKTIELAIYDPPMCCPTGLCGPELDVELLAIKENLMKLGKEFGEQLTTTRYMLTNDGPKFMEHPEIMQDMQNQGIEVLPVTTVNGKVVKKGAYPDFEELKTLIQNHS